MHTIRFASIALLTASAGAQSTAWVSEIPIPATLINNDCGLCSLSADGMVVAFESLASNLVAGDTNGVQDIFVRDLATTTITRVSVSTGGAQANMLCGNPVISADGNIVAFTSRASTLVAADTNNKLDVFVHDRGTGATTRVSVSSAGVQGIEDSGLSPFPLSIDVSGDGRYVAFSSFANNLVPGDSNAAVDIFLRDRQLGTTTRESLTASGGEAPGDNYYPSLSSDGRFLAFAAAADGMMPGDTNGTGDIFVRDLVNLSMTCASVTSAGTQVSIGSSESSMSDDGRFVAFLSAAADLVVGDTNGVRDAFVHDCWSGSTERVSVNSIGQQGTAGSWMPQMSRDGTCVGFYTQSALVPADTNGVHDVFVRDLRWKTTERVSLSSSGAQGTAVSVYSALSSDARRVAFMSESTFAAGDTGDLRDIYVRDRGTPLFASFCAGDGTGTACPCGNAGYAHSGCAHSSTAGGARLVPSGNPGASAATDTLALTAIAIAGPTLFFQGDGQQAAGAGLVFGDGLLCAGGTLTRLGVVFPFGTTAVYPGGFTPIHAAGAPLAAGDVRHYQCWYRDAATFCSAATFNLTQGVTVAWQP